jgi:hypothetical protein
MNIEEDRRGSADLDAEGQPDELLDVLPDQPAKQRDPAGETHLQRDAGAAPAPAD